MKADGVPQSIIDDVGFTELVENNEKLLADYQAQNVALDQRAKDLDGLRGKEREKLVIAIKTKLGIDQGNLNDNLRSAFSANTYDEFLNDFATSLQEILGNALLELFMSQGAAR